MPQAMPDGHMLHIDLRHVTVKDRPRLTVNSRADTIEDILHLSLKRAKRCGTKGAVRVMGPGVADGYCEVRMDRHMTWPSVVFQRAVCNRCQQEFIRICIYATRR